MIFGKCKMMATEFTVTLNANVPSGTTVTTPPPIIQLRVDRIMTLIPEHLFLGFK